MINYEERRDLERNVTPNKARETKVAAGHLRTTTRANGFVTGGAKLIMKPANRGDCVASTHQIESVKGSEALQRRITTKTKETKAKARGD